jgi:hypothetical protein
MISKRAGETKFLFLTLQNIRQSALVKPMFSLLNVATTEGVIATTEYNIVL